MSRDYLVPMDSYMLKLEVCETLIKSAENDLGPLNDAERRDLIADNTDLSLAEIRSLVAAMARH